MARLRWLITVSNIFLALLLWRITATIICQLTPKKTSNKSHRNNCLSRILLVFQEFFYFLPAVFRSQCSRAAFLKKDNENQRTKGQKITHTNKKKTRRNANNIDKHKQNNVNSNPQQKNIGRIRTRARDIERWMSTPFCSGRLWHHDSRYVLESMTRNKYDRK